MTGAQIITKFEWLVDDDNTDSTQALELVNTAYDALMTERRWNFLRKEDSSNTLVAGTVNYNVPSDFMYPIAVYRYNSSAASFIEMKIVRFDDRMKYHKVSDVLYFDPANSRLTLADTPSNQGITGEVLYIVYQYQPAQLTTATSPVFNRAFHSIIAYEMAKMFAFNDQQEKERSFNREFQKEYEDLKMKMIAWDNHFEFGVSPDFVPTDSWVNLDG